MVAIIDILDKKALDQYFARAKNDSFLICGKIFLSDGMKNNN